MQCGKISACKTGTKGKEGTKMAVTVRKYTDADIPDMVRIWNEVVDEGVAFPQTEDLSVEEGAEFLKGITFVITGSLNNFTNRDALKAEIEKAGGKVAGSVSSKTGYLINNDVTSTSGKNKKAKELGVPIIDEETIAGWLKKGSVE